MSHATQKHSMPRLGLGVPQFKKVLTPHRDKDRLRGPAGCTIPNEKAV